MNSLQDQKTDVVNLSACEQGLVYVKNFTVLIFAGYPMSTLTVKFNGCLYNICRMFAECVKSM